MNVSFLDGAVNRVVEAKKTPSLVPLLQFQLFASNLRAWKVCYNILYVWKDEGGGGLSASLCRFKNKHTVLQSQNHA